MSGPSIPVRLNRTESLRRIYAFNVDALGNQAQLCRGEVGSFVIGRNKLAAQNLRKQTGKWFKQQNLMVERIERHQRVTYENLLRLEREKTAIKDQMKKEKEAKLEEEVRIKAEMEAKEKEERDKAEKEAKERKDQARHEEEAKKPVEDEIIMKPEESHQDRDIGADPIKLEPNTSVTETPVTDTLLKQEDTNCSVPVLTKLPTEPEIKVPEKLSPRENSIKKSNLGYPKPPQSAPLSGRRPQDNLLNGRSTYPLSRANRQLIPIREELTSQSDIGSSLSGRDEHLPSIHERYRKMFESNLQKTNSRSSGSSYSNVSTTLPYIEGRHKSGSSDGLVSPGRPKPQQLGLLKLLETKESPRAGHRIRPTTTPAYIQDHGQVRMTGNVTSPHYVTGSPRERRRRKLDVETVVHYKQDYDGNIVAEHFPYKRKQFSLPKERNDAFYQKLLELEENEKRKSQQRFSNLVNDLEHLDEFDPLVEIRTANTIDDEEKPEKYAKLGNSLSSLFQAFKQDWGVLKGLDPNSEEALRLCRYLRLKEVKESSSSLFETTPMTRSLDRQVTWMT